MLNYKQKKNQPLKGNRFLISVTVLGSSGPIRFVVNEEDLVGAVIQTVLKSYAREGRFPALGSNLNDFLLYCPISETEALSPWDNIGSVGVRNFMLCRKPQTETAIDVEKSPSVSRKATGSWKTWFNNALTLKISSH
ncbi:hypothetical protein F511_06401 [Dorcoceras hygrometricum]|uniref:DUF7054 domain-containing protein n=1 Tax=Dorcoceras hygrometricum TaxID=472368 RepID=A0A2Z7AJV3_9LAMI|nr:hypothetical protein F511_06401 [Dorcoceras hygrometricum]